MPRSIAADEPKEGEVVITEHNRQETRTAAWAGAGAVRALDPINSIAANADTIRLFWD